MNGNWRDLFYFNRRERNGIFVLITLIILIFVFQQTLPLLFPSQIEFDTEPLDRYLAEIRRDSIRFAEKKQLQRTQPVEEKTKLQESEFAYKKKSRPKFNPHSFNPNNSSIADWVSVGLTEKQAKAIHRYLDKGGTFRVKTDVVKMYVIDQNTFDRMKPYLLLPDSIPVQTKHVSVLEKPQQKPFDTVYVELNSADTTELKKLRGIGSYYARQIVYYRERLGGYYSITQLYEVERMREETVQKIEPYILIDITLIRKIHINSDKAITMVRHPYITWAMAKRIQDYREFSHRFKSVEDLVKQGLLTEELYTKLAPYIEL